jgi:hypothetical protein
MAPSTQVPGSAIHTQRISRDAGQWQVVWAITACARTTPDQGRPCTRLSASLRITRHSNTHSLPRSRPKTPPRMRLFSLAGEPPPVTTLAAVIGPGPSLFCLRLGRTHRAPRGIIIAERPKTPWYSYFLPEWWNLARNMGFLVRTPCTYAFANATNTRCRVSREKEIVMAPSLFTPSGPSSLSAI